MQVVRPQRSRGLVAALKRHYGYRCQLCGTALTLKGGMLYCEAHHLRPLGGEHRGPDHLSNLLTVCPNHHVLLDYGALAVRRRDLVLFDASVHPLGDAFLDYHNERLCA